MHRAFYELVTEFAHQTGCECDLKEGEYLTSLNIEGLTLQLGLMESSGMLLIQTGVGVLPHAHREAFYADLLTANNLFSRTLGLTLGVNMEQELVTLQLAWEMGALNGERFSNLMSNVLAQAADWLTRLDRWEAPAGDASGYIDGSTEDTDESVNDSAMMFLRV